MNSTIRFLAGVALLSLAASSVDAAPLAGHPFGAEPQWVLLKGSQPTPRSLHGAAYDPVRNQLVIAGGSSNGVLNDDWWALRLGPNPGWRNVLPRSGFSLCSSRALVYDPPRDRFIQLGGDCYDQSYAPTVFAASIDGGFVSTALPAGVPRKGLAAFYDPVRDRLVVFGGQNVADGLYPQDVQVLNLSGPPAWAALVTSGTPPGGRAYHNAVYDPIGDRMIVLMGENGSGLLGDVWELTLSGSPTWTQLAPLGPGPSARSSAGAGYDPDGHRVILLCGNDGEPSSDVWSLRLSPLPEWEPMLGAGKIDAGGPHVGMSSSMSFDGISKRLIVFGGSDGSVQNNSAWALDLSAQQWSEIQVQPTPPSRAWSALALDPSRDRAVLFGGMGGTFYTPMGDLWQLPLGGGPWSPLAASGPAPAARFQHSWTYDPVRDRMILIGGRTNANLNDVWELTFAPEPHWLPIATDGTPPTPRAGHSAVYDPVRDRLIVFGGRVLSGVASSETWALSLSTHSWTLLNSGAAGPSGRWCHGAVYDPVGDRMVIFGGHTYTGVFMSSINDVWALALGSAIWTNLAPGGSVPSARGGTTTAYDPGRQRVVTFGGATAAIGGIVQTYANRNDVRELVLSPESWSILAVEGWGPGGQEGSAGIFDAHRDRLLFFGGVREPSSETQGSELKGETWAVYFSPELTDVSSSPIGMRLAIERVYPNPANSAIGVSFVLPSGQAVTVELVDLAGRRRAVRSTEILGAGRHDLRFHETVGLAAGIYFLKLAGREGIASARVCVVR